MKGSAGINLDPGLSGSRTLCAGDDEGQGAQDSSRAGGIYAELTLIYEKGEFHALSLDLPRLGLRACSDMMLAVVEEETFQELKRRLPGEYRVCRAGEGFLSGNNRPVRTKLGKISAAAASAGGGSC